MLVEFTVPMEGPRTEAAPKGVSRRPGHREDVADDEAIRLIERGMAIEVAEDGTAMKETNVQRLQRQAQAENAIAPPKAEQAVANRRRPAPPAPTAKP